MRKPKTTHKHKCRCGHVFKHSNNCHGNEEAHLCPKGCGSYTFTQHFGKERGKTHPLVCAAQVLPQSDLMLEILFMLIDGSFEDTTTNPR